MFRGTKNANFVARRYKVGRSSVYRWNKRYNGTRESLADKSYKPNSPHPNDHTEEEIKYKVLSQARSCPKTSGMEQIR